MVSFQGCLLPKGKVKVYWVFNKCSSQNCLSLNLKEISAVVRKTEGCGKGKGELIFSVTSLFTVYLKETF